MNSFSRATVISRIEACLESGQYTVFFCGVCDKYWALCPHDAAAYPLRGYDAIACLLRELFEEWGVQGESS